METGTQSRGNAAREEGETIRWEMARKKVKMEDGGEGDEVEDGGKKGAMEIHRKQERHQQISKKAGQAL